MLFLDPPSHILLNHFIMAFQKQLPNLEIRHQLTVHKKPATYTRTQRDGYYHTINATPCTKTDLGNASRISVIDHLHITAGSL